MRFTSFKSRASLYALMLLLFFFQSAQLFSQDKTSLVRGVVQNSNDEPLTGVSVIIRNSKTNFTSGTSTDSAGNFSFARISPGGPYTFTFSAVGYEKQTLAGYSIKPEITLSLMIKLVQSTASLDQVVVVGYGTQKRKDLTGSVGSLASK